MLGKAQPAKRGGNVKGGLRRVRRLPGEIAARFSTAYTAKQICPPALALPGLVNPMVPGYAHRNYHALLFYSCRCRHAGMKFPIRLTFVRHRMNRKIDPLTGRRGLKLEISLRNIWVRREKDLTDVAIPQTDGFLFSLR